MVDLPDRFAPQTYTMLREVFGSLSDARQWICWAEEKNSKGGVTKIPVIPFDGRRASSTDQSGWKTLGEAWTYATQNHERIAGVGVMLGPARDRNPEGSPDKPHLIGIDADNALTATGDLMPWASSHLVKGAYTEISPSLTGVKQLAIVNRLPDFGAGRRGGDLPLNGVAAGQPDFDKKPGVSIFADWRFFAITGQEYPKHPEGSLVPADAHVDGIIAQYGMQGAAERVEDNLDPETGDEIEMGVMSDAPGRLGGNWSQSLRDALYGDADDRSAALMSSASLAKFCGLTATQWAAQVWHNGGACGDHAREQKSPIRALARAWARAQGPMESVDPIPEVVEPATAPLDVEWAKPGNPLGSPQVLPADLMSNPPPPPKFVLGKLFPAAPFGFVGPGGSHKSTMVMQAAVDAVLGRMTWDRAWQEEVRALLLTKEDEGAMMIRRLHDMLHAMNVTQRQYQDIVRNRLFIEDWTGTMRRLVSLERDGNIHITPDTEWLVEKYENAGIQFAALDPVSNLGAGERAVNDSEAALMQAGWVMSRRWDASAICFVHHVSQQAARDETDDAYAGRGGSAGGDNSRGMFVAHAHKLKNKAGYLAPDSVPETAIEKGMVARVIHAKNSYARRFTQPLWGVRDHNMIVWHMPEDEATTTQKKEKAVVSQKQFEKLAELNQDVDMVIQHLDSLASAVAQGVTDERVKYPGRNYLKSVTGLPAKRVDDAVNRGIADGRLTEAEVPLKAALGSKKLRPGTIYVKVNTKSPKTATDFGF